MIVFLERHGIFFDKDMKIKWINRGSFADKIGLKVGDKLLRINQNDLECEEEAKRILSKAKKGGMVSLLFERNNFQFFVEVK